MLEQNYAGLVNLKKGLANIVVVLLVVVVSLSLILIIWDFTKNITLKSPLENSCLNYINSIFTEKACYLEDNQISIKLKREIKDLSISKFKIIFLPSNSLWEITGEKCLDIRLEGKKYGNYCEIPSEGSAITYIFNMTDLTKQNKFSLYVNNKDSLCILDEKDIMDNC